MGDTLSANVLRAPAALATHPEQRSEARAEISAADISTPKGVASLEYLAGCLLEAMRLWPTTGLFARVSPVTSNSPAAQCFPGTPGADLATCSITETGTAFPTPIDSHPANGCPGTPPTTGPTTS